MKKIELSFYLIGFLLLDTILTSTEHLILSSNELSNLLEVDPKLQSKTHSNRHLQATTTVTTSSGSYHTMKILSIIDGLELIKSNNPILHTFIKDKLIPSVIEHITATYLVKEAQKVEVKETKCGEYVIPNSVRGKNYDVDLILFYSAVADQSSGFVAYAQPCQLNSLTSRPNMGLVNFNPFALSFKAKQFFDQFATTLHEIYHILGFNIALYKYYINPATNQRKPESASYRVDQGEKFPAKIVSPEVVAHTRTYFNCFSASGAPLEDQGSSGSAGSHWEKTILGNEMMVGDQVANPVLSNFTLSLMKDTGWYHILFDMSEPLFWQRGKGCGVLQGQCSLHTKACSADRSEGCFYDYTFQAKCAGGQFTNDCKFFTNARFERDDCRVSKNNDTQTENLGEYLGFGSRCFTGQLKAPDRTHGNMCFKASCQGSNVVSFEVKGQSYQCTQNGQQITPQGMEGFVTCPDLQDFCQHQNAACANDCGLNGRCVKGNKCICYSDGISSDCTQLRQGAVDYSQYNDQLKASDFCPNNCSYKGTCNADKTCTCSFGASGNDCSESGNPAQGLLDFFGLEGNLIQVFSMWVMMAIVMMFGGGINNIE